MMKGGEVVSRILAAEGVSKVFGIIDGTYFGLYSTLSNHGISLITPRHETCAAHMAGTYARMSGRLGVCIASNGPGVANILPGVAVEQAEGNRVLLITSCRRVGIIDPDRGGAFQYFPQVEVTRPMTKWSYQVPSIDRLAELLRDALRFSFEGRPGVVHLDIPENIMNASVEPNPSWFIEPARYRTLAPIEPPAAQIAAAARLLIAAERPLIHIGSGVIHALAFSAVAELATQLCAPVTTSWGARAALDERRAESVPMKYIDAVNQARREADVVLVLGSRIGETDWWGKPPYWGATNSQRWIQVDIDFTAIGRNRPVDVPVRADIVPFIRDLQSQILPQRHQMPFDHRRKQLASLHKTCNNCLDALEVHLDDRIPMSSAHVAHICRDVFPEDAILVIDGGNTSIWAHFFHEVQTPNTIVGTFKMGMLGAGVSQALGAQIAHPDRQIYVIIGDGAMAFHQQEVETAVRNNLPVIYLVVCDKQWGMVKMNQQFAINPLKTLIFKSLGPDETINTDLSEIAFDQLGRAMGAYGERVADPQGLREAIARAQASKRCAVIHIDVDPVKHMWAPNLKAFKDMHEEPKG